MTIPEEIVERLKTLPIEEVSRRLFNRPVPKDLRPDEPLYVSEGGPTVPLCSRTGRRPSPSPAAASATPRTCACWPINYSLCQVILNIAEQLHHNRFTYEFNVKKKPAGIKIIYEVTQEEMAVMLNKAAEKEAALTQGK